MKNIILLAIVSSCFFNCSIKQNKEDRFMNTVSNPDSLRKRVLDFGDTNAYQKLRIASLEDYPDGILFLSLYMSNKYNYVPAYIDFCYSLMQSYGVDISTDSLDLTSMDKNTRKLLFEYLVKAEQANDENAIEIMKWLRNPTEYKGEF